jgi:hypothetical protein
MRIKPVILLGVMLLALAQHAFGQAGLPWARSEQPKGSEIEEVRESQLPLVRVRIEGSGDIWVGQAVPLNVEVIVPSWFSGAPRFPEIDIPNAMTLSPEAAVNFVVQSSGKTFSAQGRRYLIFPQVKGKYKVPSVSVEVTYAMPDGKPSAPKSLSSPSLIFEARMPAGAEGAKYFLTTDNLKVNQSLDRKLEGLKVGDSIIRMVSMTAENTVGMTLPPLSFEAPEGIRLYPDMPKISERAERGKIEATRIETVTYVLGKEGHYTLPEIAILWWDPQKSKMNKTRLSSIEFQVGGNSVDNTEVFASSEEIEKKPPDEPERTLTDRLRTLLPWVAAALGIFIFLIAIRRILSMKGISVRALLAERKRRRAEAEITYFKRFRKASLSNDARATLRELMFWLDRTNTPSASSTLKQFVEQSRMSELLKWTNELNEVLFAELMETEQVEAQRKWSGKPFYRLVAKARRAQIRRKRRQKRCGEQILSLNPQKAEDLRTWAGQ